MTERKLGTQCSTKGTDDVCSYCGSVIPDYCNKEDADKREAVLRQHEEDDKARLEAAPYDVPFAADDEKSVTDDAVEQPPIIVEPSEPVKAATVQKKSGK